MADRPKYLVDFHAHAFPEKVADRAMEALAEAYALRPVARPTPAGLLSFREEAGVDVSVILPVATRPDQVRSINDWAAATCADRLVCFGALHPDFPDPAAEIDRLVASGVKGVKFQPQFQEFSPDEPRLWPMYEALEGRMIVVFHSGQEIVDVPHVYAQPAALARVREAFPRLTLVVAHMGGYRMRREAREHLWGKPQYLETSFTWDLTEEELTEAIQLQGAERVLFGSDFPWGDARTDVARLSRLPLSQSEVEAIAWQNANRLLNLGLA